MEIANIGPYMPQNINKSAIRLVGNIHLEQIKDIFNKENLSIIEQEELVDRFLNDERMMNEINSHAVKYESIIALSYIAALIHIQELDSLNIKSGT